MKVTITEWTDSTMNKNKAYLETTQDKLETMKASSGASAGVCYSSGDYFNSYVTDYDKALKRTDVVVGTGHHSVTEHCSMTLCFEGISKLLCMYLHNLSVHGSSERSGRYTKLTGSCEEENRLYIKWFDIFQGLIKKEHPDIDPKLAEKLAMENCRYLLSVFTKTTMKYTTMIGHWNYILDWCNMFIEKHHGGDNDFAHQLSVEMIEFVKQVKPLVHIDGLNDIKDRFWEFEMIEFVNEGDFVPKESHYGNMVEIVENMSFVAFGQNHRHRVMSHKAYLDLNNMKKFVPRLVAKNCLMPEWFTDIETIEHLYPQVIKLTTVEKGMMEHYLDKSIERKCGRSQHEIMEITLNRNIDILSSFNMGFFEFTDPRVEERFWKHFIVAKDGAVQFPKIKGQYNKCEEPCMWGCGGVYRKQV